MVFPQIPPMNWNQLYEDQAAALQQTPQADNEQLPAYADAMKHRSSVEVTEKEFYQEQKQKKKSGSKRSTLKSILTGDVHKLNPRYVLEEKMTGQPSVIRSTSTSSSMPNFASLKSSAAGLSTSDVQR